MKKSLYIASMMVLMLCAALPAFAGETDGHFADWVTPAWGNPLEDVVGKVRIVDVEDLVNVQIVYSYPNGVTGKVSGVRDVDDVLVFHFAIPAEAEAGLGEMTYFATVKHGTEYSTSEERSIPMGYEEDLDITANPPEILWFALGDKSATVRYKACCNILGASIIAKRMPVNPMESSKGLPEELYSDFVWLEPDALSTSTAGLYFEFGFDPVDFKSSEKKVPVIYEYDWLNRIWEPVLSFDVVDGKVLDFPATEGGVYVLAKK